MSHKLTYSGSMTTGGIKRMVKAIDILDQRTDTKIIWNPVTKKHFPFKLNFVTLTISERRIIDPKFGYLKLLEPFLRIMRSQGSFSYVWKAEFQVRGQVHYHLATNTFLTWQKIRTTWNNLQRKNRLLDGYAEKNGHFNANSTDVHAIGQVKNVAAYLAKYFSKANSKKIKGKVWDCSNDLKGKRFAFTPTHEQEMRLRKLQDDKHINVISLDHCTIFKGVHTPTFFTPNQIAEYLKWKN